MDAPPYAPQPPPQPPAPVPPRRGWPAAAIISVVILGISTLSLIGLTLFTLAVGFGMTEEVVDEGLSSANTTEITPGTSFTAAGLEVDSGWEVCELNETMIQPCKLTFTAPEAGFSPNTQILLAFFEQDELDKAPLTSTWCFPTGPVAPGESGQLACEPVFNQDRKALIVAVRED